MAHDYLFSICCIRVPEFFAYVFGICSDILNTQMVNRNIYCYIFSVIDMELVTTGLTVDDTEVGIGKYKF